MFLFIAAILVALVVGEFGLRIHGYPGDVDRTRQILSEELGPLPDDMWFWQVDWGAVDNQITIRNQGLDIPKPTGESRFLFIGDSGTWGTGVRYEETFPYVFGQLADRDGLRSINAGMVAMNPINEGILLKKFLMVTQPDFVVQGFFLANDINISLGFEDLLRGEGVSMWDSFHYRSALLHFLRLRMMSINLSSWKRLSKDRFVDKRGLSLASYPFGEVATYVREGSDLLDHAYSLVEESLRRTRDLSLKEGFDYAVVLIPTSSMLLGSLELFKLPGLADELPKFDLRPDDLDFELPRRRILLICQRLGITCLDPTSELKEALGAKAIIAEDDHLSAAGHSLLADYIHKELFLLWNQ